MPIQLLSNKELIDLAELLNQISLDELDQPLECLDIDMLKQRGELIRSIIMYANGSKIGLAELEAIQEFYDAVKP